jgi:biotin synthase
LHERAAAAARGRFGREVFVRAVLEVSNYCRENCHYCGMRRDNRTLERFRIQHDELAELIVHHRPASVTDVNIQTGEDPLAVRDVVLPLVRTIRRETKLGVSVCLGTLPAALVAELREAGATTYIVKFEMADPQLYERLEGPGTLTERVAFIRHLAATGWGVSSGFIAGLPEETLDSAMACLRLASTLPLCGCSVSPFVPGESTPLSEAPAGDIELTLNCMAALRLMRPDWVIPAVSALNLAEPGAGYRRGLSAGANLCTINLTPEQFRGDYLLYRRDRFIMTEECILTAVREAGLETSRRSLAEFYAEQRLTDQGLPDDRPRPAGVPVA